MAKLIWLLKQLLPLTYRTIYASEGKVYYHTWNMWFGRCYAQEWVSVERTASVSDTLFDTTNWLFGFNPDKRGPITPGDMPRPPMPAAATGRPE